MASIQFQLTASRERMDVNPCNAVAVAIAGDCRADRHKIRGWYGLVRAWTVTESESRALLHHASGERRREQVTTIEGLSVDATASSSATGSNSMYPAAAIANRADYERDSAITKKPKPTDADIDQAMRGNIRCCGTYDDIRRAIHRAAEIAAQGKSAGGAL